MTKKSFFRERTIARIRDLSPRAVFRARGLVERIDSLNPEADALEIRTLLLPGQFYAGAESTAKAARKCYKHGEYLPLSQPQTQQDALECSDIPLAIRAKDFSKLEELREEEINLMGYSFRPVQGRDRTKRVVPFVWLPEAARLFAYAQTMAGGIQVKPYADSARVAREGASVVCTVPSRTKKHPRYTVRLEHVPVEGVTEKRAAIWSIKPQYSVKAPEHSTFNIRYTGEADREASEIITFYPHDIAAYIAVAGEFWKKHNMTPMEMNPFALPSGHQAEFYKKLCNNVLVFDPTLSSKDKQRKLNLAEKSILLGRAISIFGHDDFSFWDPQRDGKLKDYNWSL